MQANNSVIETAQENKYPSSYREVKIGRTYYCVTSIYTGEKKLGPTLEKLAVQHILDEMDERAKNVLRNG